MKNDWTFGKIAAELVKQNPSASSNIREALERVLAKSVAAGGQDSAYFDTPQAPLAAPAKPKPKTTTIEPGDAVTHKPSGRHGIVFSAKGNQVIVAYSENHQNSVELHPVSEVEKEAQKVAKAFMPRLAAADGSDGMREWFGDLAKSIHPSPSPFRG